MDILGALRALVAIVVLAWLPGYTLTRALLPRLAPVERFVLSVTLSITLLTLALLVGTLLLRIPLGAPLALGAALLLTGASGLLLLTRWRRRRRGGRVARSPIPPDPHPSPRGGERVR